MCRVRKLRGDLDISTLHCIRQVRIKVNTSPHSRGALPCTTVLPARLNKPMKTFITQQDEIGVPPRTILANMKKQASIPPPRRGWLTPLLIQNALKKVRRDNGTKKSIKSVREMVRANFYYSGIDENKIFPFGYKLDKDGFAHVGTGEDHDPFIIGITPLSTIDSCIKFASPGGCSLFHADATFKLSDIGYPVTEWLRQSYL
ncbi:hypothetical protein JG687_00016359 [Phytophthora cactorum]|uniref:Uncharacterized protein n=1 Tax=Phytophthora cactorum TaxID=29920 RepID=A0A8T1TTJ3_9STRA|nr:hypothetical protein JG687_00016359 [Phytophthora cactorum]